MRREHLSQAFTSPREDTRLAFVKGVETPARMTENVMVQTSRSVGRAPPATRVRVDTGQQSIIRAIRHNSRPTGHPGGRAD